MDLSSVIDGTTSALLGHSATSFTSTTYQDVRDELVEQPADVIGNALG